MTYIDCYLAPVPRANKDAYEKLARISADVMKAYGALRVVECWLDESGPDASTYHGERAREDTSTYGDFFKAAGVQQEGDGGDVLANGSARRRGTLAWRKPPAIRGSSSKGRRLCSTGCV